VQTAAEPSPETTAIDSAATGNPRKHLKDSSPAMTTDGEGTATQSKDNTTSLPMSNSMAEGTMDNPITVEDDPDIGGKTSLKDLANDQEAEMKTTHKLLKDLLNAYSAGTKTKKASAVPAKRLFGSFSASHESDDEAKDWGLSKEAK
jgi:hypothetical protein